ncbi:MAG: RNA-directed DNA polymerase [Chloroflexota bacterium]|nr:RNA-directed DNA polymerase [Chloroflexota bacterium]
MEALSHPLVLMGAWLRVDEWYRSGNLAPEPELSRWRLHPEAELRDLSSALRTGTWRPKPWPQVPYPKKGACLRHYVVPTVRDQVAFMAYLVLLGPLLDHLVPNFVFGNRWNRRVAWDRRRSRPQWVQRPYQLLTRAAYLPYARSHGLFRRVAHWTVAGMTGAQIEHEEFGGYVQHPDDYDSDSLPRWTRREWWPPRGRDDARVYWVSLDIELAYPSIRLSRLRDALVRMLEVPQPVPLTDLYGGYPHEILDALANPLEIKRVAFGLMDALSRIEIDPNSIPLDAWRPTYFPGDLPPEKDPGLPTGLAVSGILLNVALYPADQLVRRYLGDRHGAIVRFADDIFILARSARRLFDLMEVVWQGLAEDESARLARAETESNLHLNWDKIGPRPVRDIVVGFLKSQGWRPCEHCQYLLPSSTHRECASLGEWWDAGGSDLMSDGLARSTIGPGEVGPFVTTLVARMSEIGRDTLAERFGEGARERLIRLHELARFDIDDIQVRSDTRRTFAANRLVRAWLPQESSRRDLTEIRESVGEVLMKTPWKFSLWHAVVRAAARRPEHAASENDRAAAEWLSRQLRLVAHAPNAQHLEGWMNTWPEEDIAGERDRGLEWRVLYLSFHRTAFWHALAAVLHLLWRHGDEAMHSEAGYAGPSPGRWTVRAIPEGMHENVRQHLAALDRWVAVLYSSIDDPNSIMGRWEVDQLVAAVLASASRTELALAWRRAESPGDVLMVPAGPLWDGIPRTIRLLERLGRVSPHSDEHDLALSAVAHIWNGGQDRRLADHLFPRGGPSRIAEAQDDPKRTLAAAISLGCSENVGADLASALVPKPERAGEVLRDDGLALWEYHRARRILLGQPEA